MYDELWAKVKADSVTDALTDGLQNEENSIKFINSGINGAN